MDNAGFIIAAYGLVAVIVIAYTWSLRKRIKAARSRVESKNAP